MPNNWVGGATLEGAYGVAGLVVPGLDLAAVRAADPPFPVVLTESFGATEMRPDVRDALSRVTDLER